MFKKKIANIVFYKVPNSGQTLKQATIFYNDGTVQNVDFEKGIDACEEIVKERHIKTKDAFKEMINRDLVHVVSANHFRENFYRYVPEKIELSEEDQLDEGLNSQTRVYAPNGNEEKAEEVVEEAVEEAAEEKEEELPITDEEEVEEETNENEVAPEIGAAAIPVSEEKDEDGFVRISDDDEDEVEDDLDPFDGEDDFDDEEEYEADDIIEEEPTEKKGFFGRVWDKIRKSKVVTTVVLCVTALAVACGIYSCSQRKSIEGEMLNSNIPSITNTVDDLNNDEDIIVLSDANNDAVLNSHFYNDAAISSLLNRTSNQTQRNAMTNLGYAMDGFNNTFAHYYLEDGVDVRPALKFEEVVALQVAYNDYNKDQLRAYFNGADIRSEDLSRAYKDASLQLMGAYAIENSEHPVDMSMLIESQEGKDFYNRYHQAFLAAKEATGDEKLRLVQEFYNMIHNDFAISQKERTEGISHAENYESLEAYQLSVVPMVAAAEMMWQNLDIDVTLTDEEVAFFNDFGLCNFADKTFERAEYIALASETDKDNPTYDEYREAFIAYYTRLGIYYIDDEHRELTRLQRFQDAVNWHFEEGEWIYQGGTYTTTDTRTETHTWTESNTTYHEEETRTERPITDEARAEVDAEINEENEANRRRAEEAAEQERQRLQQIENENAQRIEDEIRQDEEDLQENIEEANEVIDNGGTVNEDDLGHGVDFDDEHSDSQGNLDNSVENITTDPTGDKTNEDLPDPNATGRDFDAAAPAASEESSQSQSFVEEEVPAEDNYEAPEENNDPVVEDNSNDFVEEEEDPVVSNDEDYSSEQWVESVPVDDDADYQEEAWVEYDDGTTESVGSSNDSGSDNNDSYEKAVDDYVESISSDDSDYGSNLEEEDVDAVQYQK